MAVSNECSLPFCLAILFQMPTCNEDMKFIFFLSQRPVNQIFRSIILSKYLQNTLEELTYDHFYTSCTTKRRYIFEKCAHDHAIFPYSLELNSTLLVFLSIDSCSR